MGRYYILYVVDDERKDYLLVDGWKEGWISGWISGWDGMDGLVDEMGWDGWISGWISGWDGDGWIDRYATSM